MSNNNFKILKEIIIINITILWLYFTIFYSYMSKPIDITIYKYMTYFFTLLFFWNLLYSVYLVNKMKVENIKDYKNLIIAIIWAFTPFITLFITLFLMYDLYTSKICIDNKEKYKTRIETIEFCKKHLNIDISK